MEIEEEGIEEGGEREGEGREKRSPPTKHTSINPANEDDVFHPIF